MADGTSAVWYLLKTNVTLIASVPAARITSGVIPQATALPAIGLTSVSQVRRRTVGDAAADKFVTERVQVTVHADTYPNLKAALALVRSAVTRRPGTVNGTAVDSILVDVTGPDFRNDQAGIYAGSQDFLVRFNE
jgi:hypothetical protein